MRGFRWLILIALLAWCVPLLGCTASTSPPAKAPADKEQPVKKPAGEIG
jgi:hypothetical protein